MRDPVRDMNIEEESAVETIIVVGDVGLGWTRHCPRYRARPSFIPSTQIANPKAYSTFNALHAMTT